MIVRFDEILENLIGLLTSFGGIWNYINLPLVDLYEPESGVGVIIDGWYDALMSLFGIGQYGLIHFIIGGGLTLTIFFLILGFFSKIAQIVKIV